jgi:hypothetical protein
MQIVFGSLNLNRTIRDYPKGNCFLVVLIVKLFNHIKNKAMQVVLEVAILIAVIVLPLFPAKKVAK